MLASAALTLCPFLYESAEAVNVCRYSDVFTFIKFFVYFHM
jgi:hypothetical protein